MKCFFCILFSITIAADLSAQNTTADTAKIDLYCGWAGYTSPDIIAYKKILASKNWVVVKSKLTTGTLTEKVLSAIAIRELNRSGLVALTEEEKKVYYSVINSTKRVEVCYTCTSHFEGTVRGFFHPKKEGEMTELTPFGVILEELFRK